MFSPHHQYLHRSTTPKPANSSAGPSTRRPYPIDGVRKLALPNSRLKDQSSADEQRSVAVAPSDRVVRRSMSWDGAIAETVECPADQEVVFQFNAPMHLLVVYEQGERTSGETSVHGLAPSSLRKLSGKMTFVPAGCEYKEHHTADVPSRFMFFCFEPSPPKVHSGLAIEEPSLAPRLFFEDPFLWQSASKLSARLKAASADDRPCLAALGIVLIHELARGSLNNPAVQAPARGGLAGWQQRIVVNYIRDHFSEPIRLSTLAQLARLSPHHFCRAFKQSFGKPPHRYQNDYRIDQAKRLLAKPGSSVTHIALEVGFGSSSSFATAFRKVTGDTPTGYARSLLT